MCHEQFHRARVWDREEADDADEADRTLDEPAEHWKPSHVADEDAPDDDLDVLTDGGT